MQAFLDVLRSFFGKCGSFFYWVGKFYSWFVGAFLKSIGGTVFIMLTVIFTIVKFAWAIGRRVVEAIDAANIAGGAAMGAAGTPSPERLQTTEFMNFINFCFPLEEFFNLTITYLGILSACILYKALKKWIPTVAT